MKKVIIAGALLVFGLAGLWFYARPAYKHHRETRALEQAKSFLSQGDYRSASLSARQALQVNPRSMEACRMLAEVAERSRSPDALDLRRRIVELAPTVQNKLMLASTALRSENPPYPLATQTLDELKDAAGNVAAYHAVLADRALRLSRPAEAAAEFELASRFEPTNELHQLNLAILQLLSTNTGAPSAARAILERLRASTNVGTIALRSLVAESLGRDDLSAAARFSTPLLADPRSLPDDRLQHLTILQRSQNPEFNAYLSSLQRNALTNATQVYGISTWMIGHGLAGEALAWLTSCPAKLRVEQPVPLALVNCYLSMKDWQGLDAFLQEQKWGDLEFLRFAFLSRAAAVLNQRLASEADWRTAVRLAGNRLGPLTALLSMATSWALDQAREDLLWQIGQRFPSELWALKELERRYTGGGNTYGLNKVYGTMASYAPTNFAAQNNLAATSFLLKLNLPKAHELAKEVFSQHPDQAVVVSTYAFSLHLRGRTKEGLALLEQLKPQALETPAVALYYGLLLSATGETNKAGKYLDIAQKSDLLPEEKALAAEAVKQIGPGKTNILAHSAWY
jgi:hypothetical protein